MSDISRRDVLRRLALTLTAAFDDASRCASDAGLASAGNRDRSTPSADSASPRCSRHRAIQTSTRTVVPGTGRWQQQDPTRRWPLSSTIPQGARERAEA